MIEMSMAIRNAKRQQKLTEWQNRVRLLHEKYPRLGEITRLIAQLSLELARLDLGQKGEMGREEIFQAQEMLFLEKSNLLKQHRLPPNIYDVWWDCERCKDSGFTDIGVKCTCLQQEEQQQRWQSSGLSPEQKEQTFESFSLDWYDEQNKYQQIVQGCLEFAKKVSRGERVDNLLLYGAVGTGKTHLCSAIGNMTLDAGCKVIYLKAGKLLDRIRQVKFHSEDQRQEQEFLERLYRTDLLIIDDLGTENATDFVREQLLLLFDERMNYRLPWVISTNLSYEQLGETYEDRMSDRILGTSTVYKFSGDSIRARRCLLKREKMFVE